MAYPGANHGQHGYHPPAGFPSPGGYGPPQGPPSGFPSPGPGSHGFSPPPGPPGYGPPPGTPQSYGPPSGPPGGYNPSYSSPAPGQYGGPPSGPPPGQYGGPPSGPPPGQYGGPPPGQYGGPPSGPPPGQYGAPPGPPPGQYGAPPPGQYGAPPPGPPPGQYGGPPSGPPPGQYGGPPAGPPPGQYGPPRGAPPMSNQNSYAPPPGPPPMPPSQQQNYGPQAQGGQFSFQYSQCTGRRKALCVGINYFGQSAELAGCINDAHNVQRFLCTQHGYKPEDIVMLTDDSKNPRQLPTKDNMMKAMQWLVSDARPNDALFFHYSGHGGQTKDLDGDEEDGFDEVIYPVDYEENGHIVDDDMHAIMVRPLPAGCRLTAIFDACHSGSALDLPYMYSTEGKIKEPNLAAEAGQGLMAAVKSYASHDMSGVMAAGMGIFKAATGNRKAGQLQKATRTSAADVISWSGCKDSQTSADTQEAGQATGAMSWAFVSALNENPQQSYMSLLHSLRAKMSTKYSQKPQLACSHPMDLNVMFLC